MWSISHTGKQVTTDVRQLVPGHTAHVCQRQSWPWLYILASTPVSSLLLISCLQEWTSAPDSVHDQCLGLTFKVLLNVAPCNPSLSSHAPPTSLGTLYFRWASLSPCFVPLKCHHLHMQNPLFPTPSVFPPTLQLSTQTPLFPPHLLWLFHSHPPSFSHLLSHISYRVAVNYTFLVYVMVSFLCQFHWATGYSNSWLNIISGCVDTTSECSSDDVSRRDQCLN